MLPSWLKPVEARPKPSKPSENPSGANPGEVRNFLEPYGDPSRAFQPSQGLNSHVRTFQEASEAYEPPEIFGVPFDPFDDFPGSPSDASDFPNPAELEPVLPTEANARALEADLSAATRKLIRHPHSASQLNAAELTQAQSELSELSKSYEAWLGIFDTQELSAEEAASQRFVAVRIQRINRAQGHVAESLAEQPEPEPVPISAALAEAQEAGVERVEDAFGEAFEPFDTFQPFEPAAAAEPNQPGVSKPPRRVDVWAPGASKAIDSTLANRAENAALFGKFIDSDDFRDFASAKTGTAVRQAYKAGVLDRLRFGGLSQFRLQLPDQENLDFKGGIPGIVSGGFAPDTAIREPSDIPGRVAETMQVAELESALALSGAQFDRPVFILQDDRDRAELATWLTLRAWDALPEKPKTRARRAKEAAATPKAQENKQRMAHPKAYKVLPKGQADIAGYFEVPDKGAQEAEQEADGTTSDNDSIVEE